jgi:hypothetical protein
MSLQIDGASALAEQERQLQFIETFFVEVIDYVANADGNNDVTTKAISGPPAFKIHLQQVAVPADLTQAAASAKSIVFDRTVLVMGAKQRVVGFRS